MKDTSLKKEIKPKVTKKNSYILKDSIKLINKNWSEFSISISGDFSFDKINFFCKKLTNSEFEMF
jgi:hypothetical protein